MIRNVAYGWFSRDDKIRIDDAPEGAVRPHRAGSGPAPTSAECAARGAALSGPVRELSREEIARRYPGVEVTK